MPIQQEKITDSVDKIVDLLTDIIVHCDSNYRIIESNSSTATILGMGESVVGKHCYQVLHQYNEPCQTCPLSKSLKTGIVSHINYFDLRFDEYFEERTHPIVDDRQKLKEFVIVARNVSEIRETEYQNTLDKKLAAIGQLTAGAAHDFNNVITVVLGRINILKQLIDDVGLLRHLENMEQAILGGADTIRRMQEFTKERTDSSYKSIELKKMIMDVLAITRPKWKEAAEKQGLLIQIVTDLENDVRIQGNRAELHNALTNLVFNAVDAMPDGGVLSLKTYQEDSSAVIEVRDTGTGMTEETIERIFDPFFSTKGDQGTGLGMSEVYGIVKRHSGHVVVDSKVGMGTTISLTFPMEQNVSGVAEKPAFKLPITDQPLRILSIDDEDFILETLEEMMTELGVEISCHKSPESGIKDFEENTYNAVLTDLEMPEMDGFEVARRIKAIKPDIPVILASGWPIDIEGDEKLRKIINLTIIKPFDPESLESLLVALSKTE